MHMWLWIVHLQKLLKSMVVMVSVLLLLRAACDCLLVKAWLLSLNIQEILSEVPLFCCDHDVVWYNIPLKDNWMLNLENRFWNHTNTVDKQIYSIWFAFKLIIYNIKQEGSWCILGKREKQKWGQRPVEKQGE